MLTTLYLVVTGSVVLPVALLMIGAPPVIAFIGTVAFLGCGYAYSRG